MGGKRREGRGGKRRGQERRVGGEKGKERGGEEKREVDAPPLTQIPGSAPEIQ